MKKLLVLLLAIPLSGCMYQTIDEVSIVASQKACSIHGGVRKIDLWSNNDITVKCNNGEVIDKSGVYEVINTLQPNYTKIGE